MNNLDYLKSPIDILITTDLTKLNSTQKETKILQIYNLTDKVIVYSDNSDHLGLVQVNFRYVLWYTPALRGSMGLG